MSDDLQLNFEIDSDAAVTGVEAVSTALTDTATAADTVTMAVTAIAPAVATAQPPVDAVAAATQRLQDTLAALAAAMASPSSGPRVLQRDAAQAQIALLQLDQAAKDAGVSNDTLKTATTGAADAILAASTRAATFTAELGKIRAAGIEAANQLQALQGSGTSLTGMFQSMVKTGGDATASIGKLGLGLGIGLLAFEGAKAAGEKFGAALLAVQATLEEYDLKQAVAIDQGNLLQNVLNAVTAGHIKEGQSLADTITNYTLYLAASGKGFQATRDLAAALDAIKAPTSIPQATDDLAKFAAVLEGTANTGMQDYATFAAGIDKSMDSVIASDDAAAAALTKDLGDMGAGVKLTLADYAAFGKETANFGAQFIAQSKANAIAAEQFLLAHQAQIKGVIAGYAAMGQEVPADFQAIVTAQAQAVAAQKLLSEEGATNAIAAYTKITAARAVADAAAAVSEGKAEDEATKAMKVLNSEVVSSEQYSARKTAIYNIEQAQIAVAEATQEVAAEQEAADQAKLQKSLGVSTSVFQDVADASDGYVAALVKGATPSQAFAAAVDILRKNLVDTGAALPDLNDGLDNLVQRGQKATSGMSDFTKGMDAARLATDKASKSLSDLGFVWDLVVQKFPIGGSALGKLGDDIGTFAAKVAAAGVLIGKGGGSGGAPVLGDGPGFGSGGS